ncbi:MAG TPA: hypothetical protein VFD03_01720 [Clostridia bacterium]|nr:hypothetical protein [Clostridia bacterium]
MNLIMPYEIPITNSVAYEFKPITSKFMVPSGAEAVELSIKSVGMITACTYYSPVAFY